MKTSLHSPISGIRFIALLLIGFALNIRSVHAQTFVGRASLTHTPASLRVLVTPIGNSSLLRIRYENQESGPVHIQIQDQQGYILYNESKPQRIYIGDFEMAGWKSGLYTIVLQTPFALHTDTVRVQFRSPVVATVLSNAPL